LFRRNSHEAKVEAGRSAFIEAPYYVTPVTGPIFRFGKNVLCGV
jgi:hypothetical protein